jgi:hypothetical protein
VLYCPRYRRRKTPQHRGNIQATPRQHPGFTQASLNSKVPAGPSTPLPPRLPAIARGRRVALALRRRPGERQQAAKTGHLVDVGPGRSLPHNFAWDSGKGRQPPLRSTGDSQWRSVSA